jgi:hypothetical protein
VIVAKNTPVNDNRTERVLGYMLASSIGLSVIAIVALIIGRVTNVDFSQGVWLTVAVVPPIGLTIGVLLLIARIIVVVVKRGRTAKDDSN